ncbi:MAG: porin family protein [Bacteroidota bacterium]|jgi:hypothetical protein|nr:hypothetical protein [Bacteroidota bacterium]
MKKLTVSLLALMLIATITVKAQVSLSAKGGLNMSNLYGDELTDENVNFGFNLGLALDYEFQPAMAVQTGLFFTTKGSKVTREIEDLLSGDFTQTLNYLQLPVHFAYKYEVTPETRIVFHAGPYIAYGVGGKSELTSGDASISSNKVFGDETYQYKPFDAGLGLGVGAEFGQFLLDLGWDMGLVNISRIDDGNIKNQNAYLSIGYRFN